MSYSMRLKIYAVAAGIKKCKSTIKKKNEQNKILLLVKPKLNSIEVVFLRHQSI